MEFQKRVESSFAKQGFMSKLGAQLTKVEEGSCEISLDYDESLTQQHGFFHAGVVSTLADNAAGYAAFSMMEPTSSILTVEFKLNLLAPADGDKLIARAEVLKYGRTLTVCRADVFILKSGNEKLCAAAQSTLMQLQNKRDGRG